MRKTLDEALKEQLENDAKTVKITVGDKELEGCFVVGLSIRRMPEGFEVGKMIEGRHIGPLEIVAMCEALESLKENLIDKLVESTVNGVLGSIK